ncbi:hypothetical protein FKM82_009727 [Ascaphus truei]
MASKFFSPPLNAMFFNYSHICPFHWVLFGKNNKPLKKKFKYKIENAIHCVFRGNYNDTLHYPLDFPHNAFNSVPKYPTALIPN